MSASDRDQSSPLERELAGLPELDQFTSAADRARAVRAVRGRIEDPYTLSYWVWVAIFLVSALGVMRLVGWLIKSAGAPPPFPAALGIVAGLATYMLMSRLVIRWAARPELRQELAERQKRSE